MPLSSGLSYKALGPVRRGENLQVTCFFLASSRLSIAAWHCPQRRMQGDKSRLNLTPPIARISKQLPKDPQPRLSLISRSSGQPEPPAGVVCQLLTPTLQTALPRLDRCSCYSLLPRQDKAFPETQSKRASGRATSNRSHLPDPSSTKPPEHACAHTDMHAHTNTQLFQITPTGVGSEQVTFSESLGSSLRKRSILLLLLR